MKIPLANRFSAVNLLTLWNEALSSVTPAALFAGYRPLAGRAMLFWGKAGAATFEALAAQGLEPSESPCLLVRGEHPLPGIGSLAAGEAILEFFDGLRRSGIKRLDVFLSGGASSQAWIPPAGMSHEELISRLAELYAAPLSIRELNRERSRLCALKAGGAARWLRRLAPKVRPEVRLISDVLPFRPEVVGSGPFYEPGSKSPVRHRVLADNRLLIRRIRQLAARAGVPVLSAQSDFGTVDDWARRIAREVRMALGEGRKGLLLYGGEPRLALPHARGRTGRGGRQTHLAGLLALELASSLQERRLDILCTSSDGSDGTAGASGALVDEEVGLLLASAVETHRLRRAIRNFDSASMLDALGALLPDRPTGTNVQDAVLIQVR